MDPKTALLIATLMMLLNGGVLGLMHRDFPEALRPSAVSWRIGTLLQAAGCVLLAVQSLLPTGFVLPLGNFLIFLGITGYWHALRQFYGHPRAPLLLLPTLVGTLGVYWYAAVSPDLTARITMASIAWIVILLGSAFTLRSAPTSDRARSRAVLAAVFIAVALFMLVRAGYFLLFLDPAANLLDSTSWMNVATPMIAAIMPVIGTTGFLLLCSERIRRDWERAASTDYLTGLANRRTLASAGEQRLRAARATGPALAVAVVDIDYFKAINDRYGHDIGDLALKYVAARIESACRKEDLAARQGGEEFVALFAGLAPDQALAAAERVRTTVAKQPFASDGVSIPITVSIGLASLQSADRSLDDLLHRADEALYAAKAAGRNCVQVAV